MTALTVLGMLLLAAGIIADIMWVLAVGATIAISTIIYDVVRDDDETAD